MMTQHMLFSSIKRTPGQWWRGFDTKHNQILPPRDPDGVATFCRPATRATQRPCQPCTSFIILRVKLSSQAVDATAFQLE